MSDNVDDAKTAFFDAKTAVKKEEAKIFKIQAKAAEIDLEIKGEARRKELLADEHYHVYNLSGEIGSAGVRSTIKALSAWARTDPGCDIEIQINSPGGEISAGFALFDYLSTLRQDGHKITTVGLGTVASMAGVLLQAGDTRALGENAMFLIHEGSLGAIGDFGEVEDRVLLMRQFHTRILEIFASRATPINKKTTEKWIKSKWQRTDWWLRASEAADFGFCDEVRGPPEVA